MQGVSPVRAWRMSPNAPTMPGVGTSRIASPASRQSKLATLKTRTPGTTCSMETQKADRESPSLPAFRSWGTLSAPRFRSVLSHWFTTASWRDYIQKKADQESLPGRPFSLQILQTPLPPQLHRYPRRLRRGPVLRRLQRFFGAAFAWNFLTILFGRPPPRQKL